MKTFKNLGYQDFINSQGKIVVFKYKDTLYEGVMSLEYDDFHDADMVCICSDCCELDGHSIKNKFNKMYSWAIGKIFNGATFEKTGDTVEGKFEYFVFTGNSVKRKVVKVGYVSYYEDELAEALKNIKPI